MRWCMYRSWRQNVEKSDTSGTVSPPFLFTVFIADICSRTHIAESLFCGHGSKTLHFSHINIAGNFHFPLGRMQVHYAKGHHATVATKCDCALYNPIMLSTGESVHFLAGWVDISINYRYQHALRWGGVLMRAFLPLILAAQTVGASHISDG